MAIAKITLIGMYDFLSNENDDLFKNLQLPDGVEKETFVNSLLMECGEFPVVWANPYFVQRMIGVWSTKMLDTFTREFEALSVEYNPIYNYNRFEEMESEGNTDGENKESVSAYDAGADDMRAKSKDEGKSNTQVKGSKHIWGLLPTNNMGISTTVQRMIQAEIELRDGFNIYNIIIRAFKSEFCQMVY